MSTSYSYGQSERAKWSKVIDRYEGGEKKVIAVYKGRGKKEYLVKRIEYERNGVKKKIVDKKRLEGGNFTRKVRYFSDIHESYENKDKFKRYMTGGVWVNLKELAGIKIVIVRIFKDEILYEILESGGSIKVSKYNIDYGENLEYRTREIPNGRERKKWVTLLGYNSYTGAGFGPKESDVIKRVRYEEIESEAIKKSIRELR